MPLRSKASRERPKVDQHASSSDFLAALYEFYKVNGDFSLRQRCSEVKSVSQAYVSQILNKRRNLNSKNLNALAEVFKLTNEERIQLEKILHSRHDDGDSENGVGTSSDTNAIPGVKTANHILRHWSYPYVKDLVHLKGFKSDPARLEKMLNGVIPQLQIKKAIKYLLSEGFWRMGMDGEVVLEDQAVATTIDIPSTNIRKFHQKALDIAQRGVSKVPPQNRKASTILLSVNEEHIPELRNLLDSIEDQIINFTQKYPTGSDKLMQITMHLTPLGVAHEEQH